VSIVADYNLLLLTVFMVALHTYNISEDNILFDDIIVIHQTSTRRHDSGIPFFCGILIVYISILAKFFVIFWLNSRLIQNLF